MPKADFDKKIDEWVATVNKHKGEETVPWLAPYPVDTRNFYAQQSIEWVTTDNIRHYCGGIGDRNPLFWNQDYARRTRWGGIIAPPTFTDSIGIMWVTNREPAPVEWLFPRLPASCERELLQVIRPGDRIRLIDKWLGLEERKPKEPRPYRLFFDSTQRSFINQNNEVVAVVTGRFVLLVTPTDPGPEGFVTLFRGGDRTTRRKLTDEERDAIYRGYDEETRRGADTLFWDDVVEGEELTPLVVGPYCPWDSVAFFAARPGHAVAFAINWERIKADFRWAWFNPERNRWDEGGEGHIRDGAGPAGGFGYGLGYQFEGLISRMICNWMGDDGFLRKLDCQQRALSIFEDAFWLKGKVTSKSIVNGEHLVDLEVRCENQDGLVTVKGTAAVRLLSRTL